MVRKYAQKAALASVSVAALLGFASPSFALGMPDPLQYDMEQLGTWALSGGVSGFGAFWNNQTPQGGGAGDTSGDMSLENAMIILNSSNLFNNSQFGATIWAGIPPNTAVLGYTSVFAAPNLYGLGTRRNPFPGSGTHDAGVGPVFKAFGTFAPSALPWFSVQAGILPSPDGTEVGVDWFNPTPFVSDLNNMQTTTGNGVQVNFIAGGDKAFYYGFVPGYGSTLTVRLADGYHEGHMNELGFTGLWNLTPDGSDFIVGFGHTRLSPTQSPHNFGFGIANSDLIGIGGQYVMGQWTFIPQMQYQWLPHNINTNGAGTGFTTPQSNYSENSIELTTVYQINNRWSLNGIAEIVGQNGNPSASDAEMMGDYLGLGAGAGGTGFAGNAGLFGPGANKVSLEFNPTWQFHNLFVRPAVTYTHINHFQSGYGYGANGTSADQFVGMVEIGFMLGQRAD